MENLKCKICGKDIESHDIEELFNCGGSALKRKKWDDALSLFEEAIIKNAEEPRAYFGKLMAECECTDENDLMNHPSHIYEMDSYKKAYQLGDDSFKRELENINNQISYNVAGQMYASKNISSIKSALETFTGIIDYKDSRDMAEKCKEKIYGYALEHMTSAKTEKEFLTAKSEFEIISGYSDADAKAAECAAKSDDSTDKNVIYQEALKLGRSDSMIDLKNAIKKLEEIPDFRDAQAKIEIFKRRYQEMADQHKQGQQQSEIDRQNTIQRMQQEEEKMQELARKKKLILYAAAAVVVLVLFIAIFVMSPKDGSGSDMRLFENGNYGSAVISSEQAEMVFKL